MIHNILFIEDETRIAELYAMVLKKAGYEVKVIEDGLLGYQEALKGDYDLLLLDLMLPNMSGEDILMALKNPQKTPNFRGLIVILTNFGEEEEVRRRMMPLCEGYLLKVNYTPRALLEYVRNLDKPVPGPKIIQT